ncbi:RHS repeat-associated core domain-containing protein [Streptomyces sp. NPDC101118]|uniref:RHS repeat-associated core domain-containing protein n=1 Tax=Streptomyces sp. NPDC101118 TaxID=3366109 RepID=UPI0037FFAD84
MAEVRGERHEVPAGSARKPQPVTWKGQSAAAWPKAGSATVELPAGTLARAAAKDSRSASAVASDGRKVRAGTLPVALNRKAGGARTSKAAAVTGADSAVTAKVDLKERKAASKAGVNGLLLGIGRTDRSAGVAPLSVELDYRAFRDTYGANWGPRLRFSALPACALTTPGKPECRLRTPVETRNNSVGGTLTATVDVPAAAKTASAASAPVVLAAEAGAEGPNGNFRATSLSPTGSWTGGGSAGEFSWSYPMDVPGSLGGPAPSLGLTYSSASVDGRTVATSQQSSWVGDGWELGAASNFVERTFVPCAEDRKKTGYNNPKNPTGDLCEGPPTVTLSLNGSSTQLVLEGGDKAGNKWRQASDDGSKVEFISVPVDSAKPNGEKKDYWRITNRQGVKYYFGINRLGGWAEGKDETNSVWRVPVYGNHPGEACHEAAYADSVCDQTWRWNLDAVVDPRGNVMTYWYEKETNFYGSNVTELGKSTARQYDRGGWLKRIDYGQRTSNYFAPGASRITFTVAERCLEPTATSTDCDPAKLKSTSSDTVTKRWPDVPADQLCESGIECTKRFSPTFFTRKRLTAVNTHVLVGGAYKPVDTWTLGQDFRATGDGSVAGEYPLWLAEIRHTGKNGAPLSLPPVTFRNIQLPNRVDNDTDGDPPFLRHRISVIEAESGAQTTVQYAPTECSSKTPVKLPTDLDDNHLRCYPVIEETADPSDPTGMKKVYSKDWFHKHRVDSIREADKNATSSQAKVTTFEYDEAGPAWAYDDETENVSDAVRTWSQYRGYAKVRTLVGDVVGKRTLVENRYYRGLDGDKRQSGTEGLAAEVVDSEGGKVPDREQFAGMVRETLYYNGEAGPLASATLSTPWIDGPTATRSRDGASPLEAWRQGPKSVASRTVLSGNRGQRRTQVDHEYDAATGLLTKTSDRGDTAKTGDESCTQYTYHVDAAKYLYLQKRVETLTKACDATGIVRPADVASDVVVDFDAVGNVTKAQSLSGYADGAPQYQLTGTTTFDAYGRPTSVTDVSGNVTKTEYAPATGEVATKITTTNPLGHKSSMELDPGRGLALAQVDANGRRQVMQYDSLGRLTKAWSPDRDPATQIPDGEYSYTVTPDAPVVITTKRLLENGKYRVTYDIYDAMMRLRQNQEEAIDNGRIITDTFYDASGQIWKENGAYHNAVAPEPKLFAPMDKDVPSSTVTEYDGLGRPVTTKARTKGETTWETKRYYGGDWVGVIPPEGETVTSSLIDAKGRKTQLRQYQGRTLSGAYDKTDYKYTAKGQLESVTDNAGNTWSYKYDIRGRMYESTDPDKGTSKTTFDVMDRPATVTDGRGKTIALGYDVLGRVTGTYSGSLQGTKLTEQTYDTLPGGLGIPVASTRFDNGAAYRQEITAFDQEYRPLESKITIPAAEGKLAGEYVYKNSYTETVGLPGTMTFPAAGGLASERVTFGHHGLDGLTTMNVGLTHFVTDLDFTPMGDVVRTRVGPLGKQLISSYTFDEQTRRHKTATHDQEVGTTDYRRIGETSTSYDAAGNITSITDTEGPNPTAATTDTQCFAYDYLRRMTDAWTATDNCAVRPTSAARSMVGGPDAYWSEYTLDSSGNRTREVKHDPSGDESKNVTRTYTYAVGLPTKSRLATVDTTGPSGSRTESYQYDPAGNTEKRTIQGSTQSLVWDTEGHLDKVTEGTKTTEFVYDASGNRLIRRDPTGTTLYLPGTEVRMDKAGNIVKGTRYYSHPAGPAMVRTVEGGKTTTSFLLGDHNGTATTSVDSATQAVTRRKFTPFGEERGAQPTMWPGEREFIGGTKDESTGLVHIGAREYDPALGRFISVDPEMDIADSETMNPYSYARHSPVTFSDPTGRRMCEESGPGSMCKGVGPATGGGGGGGSGTTSGGSGSTAPPPAPAQPTPSVSAADVAAAKKLKQQSKMDVIIQISKEVLKDVSGWNDIADCVGGSKSACAMIAIDAALSWGGKAVKVAKGLWKAYKLYDKWKSAVAWATKVLKRADDDAAAMARYTEELAEYRKQADAAKAAAAKADETATTAAQKADSGGGGGGGNADSSAGATCRPGNSFVPGTKVLMADGSTKAIEDLKPGDEVAAKEPETGKAGSKKVAATIIGKGAKNLVRITLDLDGDKGTKTSTVTATDGHPFWVPELRKWLKATDLTPGDWLETGAGTRIQITAVTRWTQRSTVHNLTVTDIHTYFVLAGATPILVHNCGGTATVSYDPDMGSTGHAIIRIDMADGRSQITEQVINGIPARQGQYNGLPTTGAHAFPEDLGPNTRSLTFDLPDAESAYAAQGRTIDADLGAYDGMDNSCVTYCVDILRAGGVNLPEGRRGMAVLRGRMNRG